MANSDSNAGVPKMLYLKHTARIILFYFIGLSIFFVSGFTIFKVLFADTEKTVVPDVVGRLFLGEHNKLRDDFKVELKPAYLVQYPYGYILAQDLAPGKRVDKNTKLELLVNLSDAIVQVPKLVGFSEDLVDGSLASLPVGGRIFSLRKGVVTRIPSSQPRREILAQFPPAGTPVVPNTPVSLLISDGPAPATPQASAAPRLEKGLAVSIALNAAYHLKKPAVLTLKKTDKADENATLLADAVIGEKDIQLEVGELQEETIKGKTPIDLSDLPFAQLFIPAKKFGDKDAVLTIARREPVANEDGSLYSEYYLVRNSSALPLFRRRDDHFDVYRDYYTTPVVAPVAAKPAEPATTTIVGETAREPAAQEIQKPEKSLTFSADTL